MRSPGRERNDAHPWPDHHRGRTARTRDRDSAGDDTPGARDIGGALPRLLHRPDPRRTREITAIPAVQRGRRARTVPTESLGAARAPERLRDLGAGAAEVLTAAHDAGGHAGLGELAPGTRVVGLLVADLAVDLEDAVGAKYGRDKPFDLVFHGGSGSLLSEIREALDYGVVKMNIDTDTQYAFTRPVADHMFRNYDGVLKVDGEVGNKKQYDPRAWGKLAEAGMAARVVRGCEDLRSAGTRIK